MEKLRKLSLIWKMTLIMTLLLLVPITVLCISYIETFRLSFVEEAENKMQTSLNHMQNNIDGTLSDAKSFFNEVFYRQELSYFLDDDNQLSQKEIRFYILSLQTEISNSNYLYSGKFSDIGIFSSNRQIKHSEWQFYLDDLKKKPYYKEIESGNEDIIYGAVRNRGLVSSTFDTSQLNLGDSGTMILPVYKKTFDLNTKELVGVVEVDIDVTKLAGRDSLKSENEEIGNLLLDENKEVLFDTKKFPLELEKKVISEIKKTNGTTEVSYKGHSYLAAYEKCGRTGLMKVAVQSKQGIMQYVVEKSIQIVSVTLICLFVLFALTYYIMNNVLKRLVVLDHMIGKVGKGDFTVEILEYENTEDEITRISRTFNKMTSRLEQVMEEKVQDEKTKKDAELRALQAQINPHFLYNTLENMRMQCEIGEADTLSDSLSALGELFRYSISWGSSEAPFSKEWENLKNYLSIMQMRFDDDLECQMECGGGLQDILVPKLMLQPLVENSFNHGFKNKLPPWRLLILAREEEAALHITVQDNGVGIEPGKMEKLKGCLERNEQLQSQEKQRNSIGLMNVKQRIDMLCKKGSSLHLENAPEGGIKIEIIIVL